MKQFDRSQIHAPRHIGDAVSDAVANGMGSWKFIIIQSIIMALWFLLNTAGWFLWHWDSYPFVFLNLFMSMEAAYATPVILMSQNRASARDHARDDQEAAEVETLYQINQTQLEILKLLKEQQQRRGFWPWQWRKKG